jgi:transcriptional regulator with XRE-family HTH domain
MTITPGQCRAARGLVGWSQDQLVEASGVTRATIANFELGKRAPYERTLDELRRAFEAAGVIFVEENGEGPGVRLRKNVRVIEDKLPSVNPYHAYPMGARGVSDEWKWSDDAADDAQAIEKLKLFLAERVKVKRADIDAAIVLVRSIGGDIIPVGSVRQLLATR